MSLEDVEENIRKLKNIAEAGDLRKANQTLRAEIETLNLGHRFEIDEKNAEIINLKRVIERKK
jgi:hypothetical protein